ncbi:DEAD/DEAH box helicase [Kocuria coralli]|uniref:DEAD/DEAH box helicase n=1 Tax=Kocuria coralli TaxID=1461025 RepID=A0A5J5L012_9MICC|nr:DEAD/DEAH box helicase [Kocuria coralli]KAA9395307.1 DEAD/DEAH box helicase [Kocuria coralli]
MPDYDSLLPLLGRGNAPEEVRHVRELPAREAVTAPWPDLVHPDVVTAYARLGVHEPYRHQARAIEATRGGHVVVATGTASGKSMAYQAPALSAIHAGRLLAESSPGVLQHTEEATALYLAPTKALAADQLASVEALAGGLRVRAHSYDGDTPLEQRRWIRDHADLVLCNPDMLHAGVLPNHPQWSRFLRRLRYVVVDEAHVYRGVFGSHVANVLRRLRRVTALYGSEPVFIGASATSAAPQESFARLLGVADAEVEAVTGDDSPHGPVTVVLWEPEQSGAEGENGAPTRRSVLAESADMLTDLVLKQVRTLAFVGSRRGAETVAQIAHSQLDEVEPGLAHRVAAYRAGFLPEERRELEQQLRDGRLLGLASTSALELGIDVAGLDAVLVAGWPGTRASFFQQIGRAGRAGQQALAAFIAREDPLDTYLVNHHEAIFDVNVEATIFDPSNPYVLAPHLCAAAAEQPLRPADLELFGLAAPGILDSLVRAGQLRRRPSGWFWTRAEAPAAMVSIRAEGGGPLQIVETDSGQILGSIGTGQAHQQTHPGAVYVHQGRSYLVDELDLEHHVVSVSRAHPDFYTMAREVTSVNVLEEQRRESWGRVTVHAGQVQVTSLVVSYQRKALPGHEIIGEEPLDLPPTDLFTKAVWFTVPAPVLAAAGIEEPDLPGTLHAAEHAMIGLLPLLATCDRWDVGGLSTALHADTELPTIFVHDGHPGGAGFAERGYDLAATWLAATRAAIVSCECEHGCPSCVQSPKCGKRNNPLDKAGAVAFLGALLDQAPESSLREGAV